MKVKSLSRVRLLATPWTAAYQAPLPIGFFQTRVLEWVAIVSRVKIYSLDVLLFLFGTSLLFHVQFLLLLPYLKIGFSRGRAGGLVFPSLSESSTVYCDPHSESALAQSIKQK